MEHTDTNKGEAGAGSLHNKKRKNKMTHQYDYKIEVSPIPDTQDSLIQQVEDVVQNELTYDGEIEDTPIEPSKPIGRKHELIFTGQCSRNYSETDEEAHKRVTDAIHELCPEAVVKTYWHRADGWQWDSKFTSETFAEKQAKDAAETAQLRAELKNFME